MPLDTELPFALSPEAAIEWFRQKSLLLTFSAAQLLAEERATAFTVAGLMDLALLETVRDAVDRALDEGTTLDQFRKELMPKLERAGWFGNR